MAGTRPTFRGGSARRRPPRLRFGGNDAGVSTTKKVGHTRPRMARPQGRVHLKSIRMECLMSASQQLAKASLQLKALADRASAVEANVTAAQTTQQAELRQQVDAAKASAKQAAASIAFAAAALDEAEYQVLNAALARSEADDAAAAAPA